jgi:Quinohemoprotein amine dehydrogenase A, alpha subunit, haem binding
MKLSKQTTMKAMVVVLLLLAEAMVFASRSHGQEPREAREKAILPENYLPEGEARDVIFQACVQCHDLRNTVSQRKTAAGWKRTVDEMVWRGAPLTTAEAETIAKYLAASFGPDKPIPEELQLKKKSTSDKR